MHLVRDIANPSDKDPLYPPHRFKDWYVGHCWASGLFPSGSTAEQCEQMCAFSHHVS